jgi:coenzyme F420-reducing hydrogenase gamma subunit
MKDIGKGVILKDAFPQFRNDESRIEQILTVAETDSVIEGLPPFDEDTRNRLRQQLKNRSERCPTPAE